jgi:hypothetical protein
VLGTRVHSVGMGIPTGSVGRGKGPPARGRGRPGSSDNISSLGCEDSSGEERGVSFDGGVPGEKRDGVKANGPLTWTGGNFARLNVEGISAYVQGESLCDIHLCQAWDKG